MSRPPVAPPANANEPLSGPLRIRMRGPWLEGHPEVGTYTEQRTLSTLGHLARRVDRMAVTGDIVDHGPERGAFRCRIWALLTCGRQVREEGTGSDMYAAVDGVAEALARDVDYLEWRRPLDEAPRCA